MKAILRLDRWAMESHGRATRFVAVDPADRCLLWKMVTLYRDEGPFNLINVLANDDEDACTGRPSGKPGWRQLAVLDKDYQLRLGRAVERLRFAHLEGLLDVAPEDVVRFLAEGESCRP